MRGIKPGDRAAFIRSQPTASVNELLGAAKQRGMLDQEPHSWAERARLVLLRVEPCLEEGSALRGEVVALLDEISPTGVDPRK